MSLYQYNLDWISAQESMINSPASQKSTADISNYYQQLNAHLWKLAPYPFVIDKSEYQELQQAGKCLMTIQSKILKHLCATKTKSEILAMFDVPADIANCINWQELQLNEFTFGRFDIVATANGYKFIEFNIHASVGCVDLFDSYQYVKQAFSFPQLPENVSPCHLLMQMFAKAIQRKKYRRIVMIEGSEHSKAGYIHISFYRPYMESVSQGIPIYECTELDYQQEWLTAEEGEHTLVMRAFTYSDLSDRADFIQQLYASGATIISDFEAEIRMNKKWFTLFWQSEYQQLLSAEEINVIEKFTARTTQLNDNNLAKLIAEKDNYIFKINHGYGGDGVFFGKSLPTEVLSEKLSQFELTQWSCQETIDSPNLTISSDLNAKPQAHKTVLGLYTNADYCAGMMMRLSKISDIVNVSSGAAILAWLLPVDAKEKENLISCLDEVLEKQS